jgi:hypothetical protein
MNIALAIFRFNPMIPSQVQCGVVGTGLPYIELDAEDEPHDVLASLMTVCLNVDATWAQTKLVCLTRRDNGLTCVYKIVVPDSIAASKSITWVDYDQLERQSPRLNKRDEQILRQCYHTA